MIVNSDVDAKKFVRYGWVLVVMEVVVSGTQCICMFKTYRETTFGSNNCSHDEYNVVFQMLQKKFLAIKSRSDCDRQRKFVHWVPLRTSSFITNARL